jgi:hypothetical protein
MYVVKLVGAVASFETLFIFLAGIADTSRPFKAA